MYSPNSRSKIPLALALLTAVVLSSFPPTAVATHLINDHDCTVTTGESIQTAIDQAEAYTTILVCGGTHHERLTIATDGLHLIGQDQPVLDGSLLGPGHGIRILNGTSDVVIDGFEIRSYDEALDDNDASSGIATTGLTVNITIANNTLHDNAHAGLLLVDGPALAWTIRDNTFDDHGFAHLFTHADGQLDIHHNTLQDAPHGIVLSNSVTATLHNNTIDGTGTGAIVATPGLDTGHRTKNLELRDNTITGDWTHGIWAPALEQSTLVANHVNTTGTQLTLAGNPAELILYDNTATPSVELPADDPVIELFANGPSTAQIDPDVPDALIDLFSTALTASMDPLSEPGNQDDADALASCAGQDDACLRDAFFDPAETTPPHNWTLPLTNDTLLTNARIEFIDAGTRGVGEPLANRHDRTDLNQNHTTLVLCRLYIDDVANPCQAAPRIFDYGLSLTWNEAPTEQHASVWRLFEPTTGIHASFQRIHGPDATLFKQTTEVHHDASPPSPTTQPTTPTPTPDPQRVHKAGQAVLTCAIAPTSTAHDLTSLNATELVDPEANPGSGDDGSAVELASCGVPTLLTEDLDPGLLWCTGERQPHDDTIHQGLVDETIQLWPWSTTCASHTDPKTIAWTDLFNGNDLTQLAAAHLDFDQASDPVNRTDARQAAERTFEGAIARHLALELAEQGMPRTVNQTALGGLAPSPVNTTLPAPVTQASAIWTGQTVYTFGGQTPTGYSQTITAYEPETQTTRTLDTQLPLPTCCTAAVWTGEHAYLFGGQAEFDLANATNTTTDPLHADLTTIHQFDPATEQLTPTPATLPTTATADLATAWDPRSLPLLGCPEGCAYIFGAGDEVYRFDPTTQTVQPTDTTLANATGASAVWTGDVILLFGGPGQSQVRSYDPISDQVAILDTSLHVPGLTEAASVFDGESVYLLGGHAPSTGFLDTVARYDATNATLTVLPETLPTPRAGIASAWADGTAYLLGGAYPISDEVLSYDPDTNRERLINETVTSAQSFDVIDVVSQPETQANVELVEIQVSDAEKGWHPLEQDPIVAFTPVNVTVRVNYMALNGDIIDEFLHVHLLDQDAEPSKPLLVDYAGNTYGTASASDADNIDPTGGYLTPTPKNAATIPNVQVRDPATGETLDEGLFTAGFQADPGTTSLGVCAEELWTALPTGATSNLDPDLRLAIDPAPLCELFTNLTALELKLQVPLALTLELRDGDALDAELAVVHQALENILASNKPGQPATLDDALNLPHTDLWNQSAEPVAARVIVTVPQNMSALAKAHVLALLLDELSPLIPLFAVEIDDLPLPPRLAGEIGDAVEDEGTIILAPAGRLPVDVRSWPPEDKLLTISGLAGHPQVLTIGAATLEEGVAPWSRRGPTANLIPKPSLVAPSPEGTTNGAVTNVLPFVESLMIRGLQDVNLVHAVLAGYAVPIPNEAATPATYYDQGAGLVDLASYLELPSTQELIELTANRTNRSTQEATEALATTLNTTTTTVQNAQPGELLGLTAPATSLIKTATGEQLINLTINTPSLPASLVADFGVVNYARPGLADVKVVDLDPMIKKTTDALTAMLEDAGYTGTELDGVVSNITNLLNVTTQVGQEITINITHYRLTDLFAADYLYTVQQRLVEQALEDTPEVAGINPQAVSDLIDRLKPWHLEAYNFTPEHHGNATMTATLDRNCRPTASDAFIHLADTALFLISSEVSRLARTSKNVGAIAIATQLPSNSNEFISERNQRFVHSQGQQLVCLEDIRTLLNFLRERGQETKALQQLPHGMWNQTEAIEGTWDQTPLGQQLANTSTLLDQPKHALSDNATIVIDVTLDALDRSIGLLESKINLTRIPKVSAGEPSPPELFEVPTLAERTAAAPLGPYTGIAHITNHNLSVYNPFTGEPVLTRDLTIPIPSFLFNNPTLQWNEIYRDTSPVPNTQVLLHKPAEQVFGKLSMDLSVTASNDVEVSLAANVTDLYENQTSRATELISTVDEILSNDTLRETLGEFEQVYLDELLAYNETLVEWRDASICVIDRGVCTDLVAARQAYWFGILPSIVVDLYSHLVFQDGVTNETGVTEFYNLFPGGYENFIPYRYPSLGNLSEDPPIVPGGQGALAGALNDPNLLLHRQVNDRINTFQPHPTETNEPPFAQEPPTVPAGFDFNDTWFDWFPVQEVHGDRSGPFHQFEIALNGFDLMVISCIDLRLFVHSTKAPLAAPGCEAPPRSLPDTLNRLRATAVLDCILEGNPEEWVTRLTSVDQAACASIAEALDEDQTQCVSSECAEAQAREELIQLLTNLGTLLDDLSTVEEELLIPWVRSPARVLEHDPDTYGYTPYEVRNASKPLNENNTNQEIWDAVNETLDAINVILDDNVHIEEPDNVSNWTHTIAQGILGHTTDKIAGTDWTHISTKHAAPVQDAANVSQAIREAALLIVNDTDQTLLEKFRDQVNKTIDDDGVSAFNTGLNKSSIDRAASLGAGWSANGTTTVEGLRMDEQVQHGEISASDACDQAESASAIPEAYLACETIVGKTGPSSLGVAGVDKVSLANQLLEHALPHKQAIDDIEANAALLEDILERAVTLSAADPDTKVRRTEQGISFETSTPDPNDLNVSNLAPAIGVMHYSTPVPINEYVQYRLDGEFLLENSAALVITTGNPVLTEAIVQALEILEETLVDDGTLDPDAPGQAVDNTLRMVDILNNEVKAALTAVSQASEPDPLLRIDLLGFPIKTEQRTNLPRLPVATPLDDSPACVSEPGGKAGKEAEEEEKNKGNALQRICAQGLTLVRPDGYYNYTHTYEFMTKERGPERLGIERLDTLILYFPSLSRTETPALPQRVAMNNLSLQVKTYIGLGSQPAELDTFFGINVPLGFRNNVEDFNLLYAIPDEPLTSTPEGGVAMSYTVDGNTVSPTVEDLVAPIHDPHDWISDCPDSAAPGFQTDHFWSHPRAMPSLRPVGEWRGLYWSTEQECLRNTVHALRPQHIRDGSVKHAWMGMPGKEVRDAFQYQFNVGPPTEAFTERRGEGMKGALLNPLNDPLSLIGAGLRATGPVGPVGQSEELAELVAAELEPWDGQAGDQLRSLTSPVIDLSNALPFLNPSFLEKNQSRGRGHEGSESQLGHNYVVIDQDDLRGLMADPNGTRTRITLIDESDPSAEADTITPESDHFHAQRIEPRTDTDYQGVVLAHAFLLTTKQGNDTHDNPRSDRATIFTNRTLELLAGQGHTGTGYAMRLVGNDAETIQDTDNQSAVQDPQLNANAKIRLEVYSLGGNHTAGSHCPAMPLFDYVRGYFRCTGWDGMTIVHEEELSAGTSECYDTALDLLAQAHRFALNTTVEAGTRPWFQPDSTQAWALSQLGAVQQATTPTPPEQYDRILGHGENTKELARDATGLLKCVEVERDGDWPFQGVPLPSVLAGLLAGIDDLLNGTSPVNASEAFVNVTATLQPSLAENGEPPRRIDVALGIDAGVREAGAIAITGEYDIDYAVDEWNTELDHAWLNITTNPPGEPATTATVVELDGLDEQSYEASHPLDLEHGTTYTISLEARDVFGFNVSDEVTFMSDVQRPDLLLGQPAEIHSNFLSMAPTWKVEDLDSGLRKVVVREGLNGENLITEVTPPREDANDPLTVSPTIDLSGWATGDTVYLQFKANDYAGNQKRTNHKLYIDREPPKLTAAFDAGALISDTSVTFDWSASDQDHLKSELDELRVWVEARGTGEEEVLIDAKNVGVDWVGQDDRSMATEPDTVYDLKIRATDLAGNEITSTLDTVEVQIPPLLDLILPRYKRQIFADDAGDLGIRLKATTEMEDYPGMTVDKATIDVNQGSSDEHTATFTDVLGTFKTTWKPPNPPESYFVEISAEKGDASAHSNQMKVKHKKDSGAGNWLDEAVAYGVIDSSSGVGGKGDVFAYLHDCGQTSFSLRLDGFGDGVDVYVSEGSTPSPSSHDFGATGSDPVKTLTVPATSGSTYKIRPWWDDPTRATYELVMTNSCLAGAQFAIVDPVIG